MTTRLSKPPKEVMEYLEKLLLWDCHSVITKDLRIVNIYTPPKKKAKKEKQ